MAKQSISKPTLPYLTLPNCYAGRFYISALRSVQILAMFSIFQMENVEDDQINSLVFNYLVQLDSKLARDFKEEAGGGVNGQFLAAGGPPSLGDVVKFFLKKDKPVRTRRGKQFRKRNSVVDKPLKIKSASSKKSKKKLPKPRRTTRVNEKHQENDNSEVLSVEEIEADVNSEGTENFDAKVRYLLAFIFTRCGASRC